MAAGEVPVTGGDAVIWGLATAEGFGLGAATAGEVVGSGGATVVSRPVVAGGSVPEEHPVITSSMKISGAIIFGHILHVLYPTNHPNPHYPHILETLGLH